MQRVLRGISPEDAAELTDPDRLLALADAHPCPHLGSTQGLRTGCDLGKDPATKRGVCSRRPEDACHLKRHTELLKRYGHFGKVPTSLALMLREHGVRDLAELHASVVRAAPSRAEAARRLQAALCCAWRVSDKISAMFLSLVANPDLSPGLAPWAADIDWSGFVVVDSNVDDFLAAIGHSGPKVYSTRRAFIMALAQRLDLAEMNPGVSSYNPRLVQQAMFLLMSKLNRRLLPGDCCHEAPSACRRCPEDIRNLCTFGQGSG